MWTINILQILNTEYLNISFADSCNLLSKCLFQDFVSWQYHIIETSFLTSLYKDDLIF